MTPRTCAGTPRALSIGMTSTTDLERWIETSRQHRQLLKVGVLAFGVLALFVRLIDHGIGLAMLFVVAVVAVSGFWILAAHIADWEAQLARRSRSKIV